MIEVVAGILRHGEKVLIARRAAHKSLSGKWEFPGGKREPNESPENALKRELFEEFGVQTKTGKHIYTHHHDYGTFQIKLLAYASQWLSGEFLLTDHDQIAWVSIEELKYYELAEADVPIINELCKSYNW